MPNSRRCVRNRRAIDDLIATANIPLANLTIDVALPPQLARETCATLGYPCVHARAFDEYSSGQSALPHSINC